MIDLRNRMLTAIIPKLPMRNKAATRAYYVGQPGFSVCGGDFEDYLMLERDGFQLHFFLFTDLDPKENYGQLPLMSCTTHWCSVAHRSTRMDLSGQSHGGSGNSRCWIPTTTC